MQKDNGNNPYGEPAQYTTSPSDIFQIHIFNKSYCNYVVCTIAPSESRWLVNKIKPKLCFELDSISLQHCIALLFVSG